MRAGHQVYGPHRVAARGGPVGGLIEGVGIVVFHTAEIIAALAQPHGYGGVYVQPHPQVGRHGVRCAGEAALAAHIHVVALVPPADDARHLVVSRVGIHVPHLLPLVVGQLQAGPVAKVPDDAVGRTLAPAPEVDGVVQAPQAVALQLVCRYAVHRQVTAPRLAVGQGPHGVHGIGILLAEGHEIPRLGAVDAVHTARVDQVLVVEIGVAERGACDGPKRLAHREVVYPHIGHVLRAAEQVGLVFAGVNVIVGIAIERGVVVYRGAAPPLCRLHNQHRWVAIVEGVLAVPKVVAHGKEGQHHRCRGGDVEGSFAVDHLEPLGLVGAHRHRPHTARQPRVVHDGQRGGLAQGGEAQVVGVRLADVGHQKTLARVGRGQCHLHSHIRIGGATNPVHEWNHRLPITLYHSYAFAVQRPHPGPTQVGNSRYCND